MSPSATGRRPRQARSIANDAAILDATVLLLDAGGWEDCSVLRISDESGLSRPAILDRYDDRAGVVVATWHDRLAPVMRDALSNLIACIHADNESIDPARLLEAFRPFFTPDQPVRAAAETILVSRYVTSLEAEISETLGTDLETWLTPRTGHVTKPDAARRSALVSLALGMLVEACTGHQITAAALAPDIAHLARVIDTRVAPAKLPATRAMHLLDPPDFNSEDPALSDLLAATVAEVGARGYEAATVQRIARASGYSKGLIFSRYASKRELFIDATDRMLLLAAEANWAFQQAVAATTSPGIADAIMTREFMRPELKQVRTITTEQYRLAWHDQEMHDKFEAMQDALAAQTREAEPDLTAAHARGRAFISLARGIGMGVLADLHPPAWQLPHDVVSVPLVDSN